MMWTAGGDPFRAALALADEYEAGKITAEELRRRTGMNYTEILRHWYLHKLAGHRQNILRFRQAGLITAEQCRAILEGRPIDWDQPRHDRRICHESLGAASARTCQAPVLEDDKAQELANKMTEAAAQVTAMAQSEAIRVALAGSPLTPEQLSQTAERAARAVRTAIKKQRGYQK